MPRKACRTSVCLFLLLAAAAGADPRWWTHDRAITAGPEEKGRPDVALFKERWHGWDLLFVVWEQASPAGQTDVWLLASADGGLSWCAPRLWAGDPFEDETGPRIQLAEDLFGHTMIAVVYERGGRVYATGDDTLGFSWDPCDEIAQMEPQTVLLSRPAPLGEIDSRPRLAAAYWRDWRFDLYAVWERRYPAGGSPSVELARNLSFGNPWTWIPARDLTGELGGGAMAPEVSADTLGWPGPYTNLTLFYRDAASGALRMSRNERSGDPGGWNTVGLPVSASHPPLAIAASSSRAEWSAKPRTWHAVAWVAEGTGDIWFDAARWTDPALRSPEFAINTDELAGIPKEGALAPALGVAPGDGTKPLGTFVIWPRAQASLPAELYLRGGLLDPATGFPTRYLDTYPIRPVRRWPPDFAASLVTPFTMCSWDELSGECRPRPRPAASTRGAGQVSYAENDLHRVAVFSDDRTGVSQIYLKRTDVYAEIPTLDVSLRCEARSTVTATATFTVPGGPDSIERFLLYHDTRGSAGPFLNRTEIRSSGASLGGLPGGRNWTFALLAEDEARNIYPPDFDPATSTNNLSPKQVKTLAAPLCVPDLAISSCQSQGSRCAAGPWSLAHEPYPGELVRVTLWLQNRGDWPATTVTGTLRATRGTIYLPPGGDLARGGLGTIAPGTTSWVDVWVRVDPTLTCPDTVELTVDDLASEGGQLVHGPTGCPSPLLQVNDCSMPCTCLAEALGSLGNSLRAVKTRIPPEAVTFRWAAAGDGATAYHVNQVSSRVDIPWSKRPIMGRGREACSATAPNLVCVDSDAIITTGSHAYYQAYSACGSTGQEEGLP